MHNTMTRKHVIQLCYRNPMLLGDLYTPFAIQFPRVILKYISEPFNQVQFLEARMRPSIFMWENVFLLHMMHPTQRLAEGEVVPGRHWVHPPWIMGGVRFERGQLSREIFAPTWEILNLTENYCPTHPTLKKTLLLHSSRPLDYKSHIECTSPLRSQIKYICALPFSK